MEVEIFGDGSWGVAQELERQLAGIERERRQVRWG
jgi:hypothetical protein